MNHTCRADGAPVGVLDWPLYAAPGEIVRLAGQDRWGRVDILWRCCGVIDVTFCRDMFEAPEVLTLTLVDVIGAYQDCPANLPPNGCRIPVGWPRVGDVDTVRVFGL